MVPVIGVRIPAAQPLFVGVRLQTYYLYILTNEHGNVMYIGMTNDIERRVAEHRSGEIPGFTRDYNVHKLVYLEEYQDVNEAIAREKQLKRWSRSKKNALVERANPEWKDLAAKS